MKKILKGPEPDTLTRFRTASPDATWEEMRNDALHGGQEALKDCRDRTLADQRGLCAYCECRLETGAGQVVVEHIHPKSDASTSHNWHLDWRNMVANCRGGENEGSQETPLPDNLSCTASKKDAPLALNPLELPAFPNLFDFDKGKCHLLPDRAACAEAGMDADALDAALETLNLNCSRLARKRHKVLIDIEQRKKLLAQRHVNPKQGMAELAHSYFQNKWPEFFTTIRCCLGQAAEDFLRSINFTG